ncbi:hypothetical protein [Rathayibacter sp. AY1D9]|uniref:hypothetical protein n=1 Tax=Rathayibacter sp. AY1D9 TaxID=2080548 RepID=UPI000CE78357|nr:hypothetical protein [Rathayibacter sp. AY1D9]PPH80470.1 hypothetical protein C5C50_10000 [Rathayibacter sp. AY1D9]
MADRIMRKMVDKDQGAALSVTDRTAAWAQLAFEGVSAAAIAKRTGTKTDAVKKGLAVAESATVTSVLHEHELTLDQAAVLLEFEDDADARATLIEVATHDPAQFEHTVQTLRDEAAHQALLAATAAEYTGNVFQILTRSDAYGDQATWTPVRQLRGEDGKSVTPEQVAAAPGRGVLIDTSWRREVEVTLLVQDPIAARFTYAYNAELRVIANQHEERTISGARWLEELRSAAEARSLSVLLPPIPKRVVLEPDEYPAWAQAAVGEQWATRLYAAGALSGSNDKRLSTFYFYVFIDRDGRAVDKPAGWSLALEPVTT